MNKTLRSVLSVFMSVLLFASPLTGLVPVFASFSEEAQQSAVQTLAVALDDYAEDQSANNRFRVLKALGPVVSDLTVKLNSEPTVKDGALTGGTSGANFMGELRSAVKEAARASGNDTKETLLNEFIPTVGSTGEYHSLANYAKSAGNGAAAGYALDSTVGDVTVSATREAYDAIADYDWDHIEKDVVVSYSITYHCAVWQDSKVSYTEEKGAVTGASESTYEFYYFSAKPTLTSGTTDVSAQKAAIEAFIARFGLNSKDYGMASLKDYIADRSGLYTAANIAAIAEESVQVYNNCVNLGYEWWGNFISSAWVDNNVADFIAECKAAMYARVLTTVVNNMNEAADYVADISSAEEYTQLYKKYSDLTYWLSDLKAALSKSDLHVQRAYAQLTARLGLRDWTAYEDALAAMKIALDTYAAAELKELVRPLLAELQAAEIPDEQVEADVQEQYIDYINDYLDSYLDTPADGGEDEALNTVDSYLDGIYGDLQEETTAVVEETTAPAASATDLESVDEATEEGFTPVRTYFYDTLTPDRMEYILGVLAGASALISDELDSAVVTDVFENYYGEPVAVESINEYAKKLGAALNTYGYESSFIASALKLAIATKYTNQVNVDVDDVKDVQAIITEAKSLLGESNATVDAFLTDAIHKAYDVLYAVSSRQISDAYALYTLEGDAVTYANYQALQDAIEAIDADLYAYLTQGDAYAQDLMYLGDSASQAQTPGVILIASAAGGASAEAMYTTLTTKVLAAAKAPASYTQAQMETTRSPGSSTNDTYTIRRGDTAQDLARTTGEDYYVTNTAVSDTIYTLDKFLGSSDVTRLLNLKKEDGTSYTTTSGREVANLNELIDAIMREKLYSDEIMNKLIETIYPLICNMVKVQVAQNLFNADGKHKAYDPIDLDDFELEGSWGIFHYALGGDATFYFNGAKGTKKLWRLLQNAQLAIYPQTLAQMSNIVNYFNTAQGCDVYTKLASAGGWIPNDRVGGVNYAYNNFMSTFDGDWNAVDYSTGKVMDYNPNIYTRDESGEYHINFTWNINGSQARFKQALTAIIQSILPVAQIVFGGNANYEPKLSEGVYVDGTVRGYEWERVAGTDMAKISARVDIVGTGGAYVGITVNDNNGNAYNGYRNLLAPIFEAIGVSDYSRSDGQPTYNTALSAPSADASAAAIVDSIMNPLQGLINQVSSYPIDKILSILPMVVYAVNNDMITPLLQQINLKIALDIFVDDFDDIDLGGVDWIDLATLGNWLKGTINGWIPDFDIKVALGDYIDLADLLDVEDITNINSILKGLLAKADNSKFASLVNSLPQIEEKLGRLGTRTTPSSLRTIGTRYMINADKPDVLWYLFQFIGRWMAKPEFVEVIKTFIVDEDEDTTDGEPSMLDRILSAIGTNPDAVGAAIIELFQPKVYNNATYSAWTTANAANAALKNKAGSSYVYLKYGNDWTYDKAETLVSGANDIFSALLKKTLTEGGFVDEDGNADFGAWLNSLIGKGFKSKNITGFMKVLVKLGDAIDNEQLKYILSRFTSSGINLHAWTNAFGYLFDDETTAAEDRHLKPGDAGYANVFPNLIAEPYDETETVTDADGNTTTVLTGKTLVKWTMDGKTFIEEEEGKTLTDAERKHNRQVYQTILGYIFEPIMPAVDIFLSGKDGGLFDGVITIKGNYGYDTAVIPLFEGLGVPADKIRTQSEFDALSTGKNKLNYIMDTVFDYLEALYGDSTSENNIISNGLTKLIPTFVHFVESNGVSVVLRNLLKPLLTIVDTVRPILNININNYIGAILADIVEQLLSGAEEIEFELPKDSANAPNPYGLNLRDLTFNKLATMLAQILNTHNNATPGSEKYFDVTPLIYGLQNIAALESKTETGKSAAYPTRTVFTATGTDKYGRANAANVLTALVSAVLDLVMTGKNAALVGELITVFVDDEDAADINKYIDILDQITSLLRSSGLMAGYLTEPDWFYFNNSTTVTDKNADDSLKLPGRTIYYLRYGKGLVDHLDLELIDSGNLWTPEFARNLIDSVTPIANLVVSNVTDYETVKDYLVHLWSEAGGFFTKKTIGTLAETINNVIPEEVENFKSILNVFLSTDLDTWISKYLADETDENGDLVTDEDGNVAKVPNAEYSSEDALTREEFSAELSALLSPLDEILSWLLTGRDYKFFYASKKADGSVATAADVDALDQIVLAGGDGYNRTLVPILEAFGCEPKALTGDETGVDVLSYSIEAILDKVDSMVNADDPIGAVLDLLPNLIYFINASGLSSSILNLFAPVAPLAMAVAPVLLDEEKDADAIDAINNATGESAKFIALVDSLLGDLLPEDVSVGKIDMKAVLSVVKDKLGINVYDAVTLTAGSVSGYNYLENFYIGSMKAASSANGLARYTMNFTDADQESKADLLTILLYTVFDVLNYKDAEGNYVNDPAIAKLIDKNDPDAAIEKLNVIRGILQSKVDEYKGYDWFYFNDALKGENLKTQQAQEMISNLFGGSSQYIVPVDKTTMKYLLDGYLNYTNENIWNLETAQAVKENFYDIANMAVRLISDYDNVSDYLKALLTDSGLYTKKTEYAIGSAIANVVTDLDDSIKNVLGLVLPDFDAHAWDKYLEEEITDENNESYTGRQFVKKLTKMFKPFGFILDWLLVGENKSIKLFYLNDNSDAIDIGGANGFEMGLVPMLEALGCELDYNASKIDGLDAIEITLNAIVDRVDQLVNSDDNDTLQQVVDMLPNLIYFINANGLSVSVQNLLRGVTNILEKAAVLVGNADTPSDINTLLGLDKRGIDVYNLNFVGICNIVYALTNGKLDIIRAVSLPVLDENGTQQTDDDGNLLFYPSYLESFAIGKVVRYQSANGETYYKMVYAEPGEADGNTIDSIDIFTILVGSAFDVFKYRGNEDFWADLLKDDENHTKYKKILALLNSALDFSAIPYDWFYFDENVGFADFTDIGSSVPVAYTKSSGYLVYNNNWTREVGDYIKDNADDIANTIITAVTKNRDVSYTEMNAFLQNLLNDSDLLSWKTVNRVGALVGNALGSISDSVEGLEKADVDRLLQVVLGGTSLAYWDTYINEEHSGKLSNEQFAAELLKIVEPIDKILSWLLVGKDQELAFMYDRNGDAAVSVKGANGFENGLMPIFEALGCDFSDYNAEGQTGTSVLSYALTKLLDVVTGITEADKPVEAVVAMVPELLYFINANGLSVSVRNLVSPVLNLALDIMSIAGLDSDAVTEEEAAAQNLDRASAQLNKWIRSALGLKDDQKFDVNKLDITGVFDIVETFTGLTINDAVTYEGVNIFEKFAVGEVYSYKSGNGETYYKMRYSADNSTLDSIDMFTILVAAVVNVFTYDANEEPLAKMIGEDAFNAINAVLSLEKNEKYVQYRWLFTKNNYSEYDESNGAVISPLVRSEIFGYGAYDQYWTREKAQYVTDNLNKVISNTMRLLGIRIDGFDLSDLPGLLEYLLQDFAYTTDNMDKIANKVLEFIGKLDEIDPNGHVKALINKSLGVDLTFYDKYKGGYDWQFESGDRDGFVAAIVEFVSPLYPVLKWLLLDEDIAFFNDADESNLVTLPGGRGYEQAIIPLLEAFNYKNENIKTFEQYKADIAADPNAMITDILTPLLDFVDFIVEDPLNNLLDRLPALIYFINSKGLDTAFRNVLHPVYEILTAIKPLVEVDLYDLMNIDLETLDFEWIYTTLINRFLPGYADELIPVLGDTIKELTMGRVVQFTSKNGQTAFTMEYVNNNAAAQAAKADMITVILRFALKWLTLPENQETVRKLITNAISDATTREYVLATYNTFVTYLDKPQGITMMMGLAYYVFFGWDKASEAVLDRLDETNDNWKFVIGMIDNSDVSYIESFAETLHRIFDKTKDVVDEDGVVSSGFVPFFQKIIAWIKSIVEWIKTFFGKK